MFYFTDEKNFRTSHGAIAALVGEQIKAVRGNPDASVAFRALANARGGGVTYAGRDTNSLGGCGRVRACVEEV